MWSAKLSIKQLFNRFRQSNSTKIDYTKDYYQILGLKKSSLNSEIKKQYYKMAKLYHPDVNQGVEDKFKLINEAYEILGNQKLKKLYDNNLAHPSSQSTYNSGYHQNKYTYNYSNYSNYSRTKYQNQQRQKVYEDQYQYQYQSNQTDGSYNQFYDEYIKRENQYQQQDSNPESYPKLKQKLYFWLIFPIIFQILLYLGFQTHSYYYDGPQLEYTVYDQKNDLLYLVDHQTYQRVINEGNFKAIDEKKIKEIQKSHQQQEIRLKKFQATYDTL